MLNTPLLVKHKETQKEALLIDHVVFTVPFGSAVRVENYYIIADVDTGNMTALTEEFFLRSYKVVHILMSNSISGLTKVQGE